MSDDGDEEAFDELDADASDPDAASPFDELDADVDDVDLDELFDEMFTESETEGIDSESVWERLEGGELGELPGETGSGEGHGDAEAGGGSSEEHIVAAREFCAQCEHAAEPPGVHCTYEGSEIVEFVDKNNVRVRNCPIVAKRRQVGDVE